MNPTEEQLKNRLLGAGLDPLNPGGLIQPITGDSLAPTQDYNFQSNPTADPVPMPIQYEPPKLEETPAEKSVSDLISSISSGQSSLAGKEAYRSQQEGVFGLQQAEDRQVGFESNLYSLNTEFKDLQNEYNNIPDVTQLQATGRGITAAGLAPITASELRKNAIRQRAVASKALTVSAMLDAARGAVVSAKSKIDRAVNAKYAQQEADVVAKIANLELLLKDPKLAREQSNRANAQLAIQKKQEADIAKKKENETAVQAMIAATMKLYSADQGALLAANQALTLNPSDPQYLQKAFALLGKYQADPLAIKKALLETQVLEKTLSMSELEKTLKNAQIKQVNAQTQKTLSEIKPITIGTDGKPVLSEEDATKANKELVATDAYKVMRKSQDSLQALAEFEKLFTKTGGTSAVFSPRENVNLKAKYNAAILNLKEFFNLGVLNGPDEAILRSVLPDPTNRSALLSVGSLGIYSPSSATNAGLQSMKAQIEQTIDDRFQSIKAQFDYSPESVSSLKDLNRIYVEQKMKLNPEVARLKTENPVLTNEDIILILGK